MRHPAAIATHAYIEGVQTRTGADGRLWRLCRICGKTAHAGEHRGHRITKPGPTELARQARGAHPFRPGDTVFVNSLGRRYPRCADCGLLERSHRPHAEPEPAHPLTDSGRLPPSAPPVAVPSPVILRPWQIDSIAAAADDLLAMPDELVGWALRVQLIALRGTLASLYADLIAPEAPAEPEPADAVTYLRPRLAPAPPSSPIRAGRKIRRGIHSPKVRGLFDAMLEQGWIPRHGAGTHIVMQRGEQSLTLAATLTEGNPRGWRNLRAAARRLGIDTGEL